MKSRRFVVAGLVVVPFVVVGLAVAAGAFDGAKSATARFHDLDKAVEAGYAVRVADLSGATCIASAEGGMGVHMLKPSLLDGEIDATNPELLVYEQTAKGRLKLAALEYLVFVSDWSGTSPPSLFGREFDLVPAGNRYGLPPFYALHAWIWKPNPSGILNAWNPRVHC
jgi:hypothetical protein